VTSSAFFQPTNEASRKHVSLHHCVVDQGDRADIGDDVLVYRGVADGLMAEDIEVIKLELRNAARAIFASWPQ
jgi:hypothetical protein